MSYSKNSTLSAFKYKYHLHHHFHF